MKKLTALIFLINFLLLLGVNFFTIHSHQNADGRLISHSHLLLPGSGEVAGKSGRNQHTHSQLELVIIQLLHQQVYVSIALVILLLFLVTLKNQVILNEQFGYLNDKYVSLYLRAPPSFI